MGDVQVDSRTVAPALVRGASMLMYVVASREGHLCGEADHRPAACDGFEAGGVDSSLAEQRRAVAVNGSRSVTGCRSPP